MDSFLYIFDESNLREDIACDDNSGDGKNARVIIDIQKDIRYRIQASSAEPRETGKFSLTVEKL